MSEMTREEALAHFGVKGMKWGVRNQRRLDRAKRVAEGKGSLVDKVGFTLYDTSSASITRNKGVKGAAASRARELEARKKRIEAGKANAKDFLALHGGDRLYITGKA